MGCAELSYGERFHVIESATSDGIEGLPKGIVDICLKLRGRWKSAASQNVVMTNLDDNDLGWMVYQKTNASVEELVAPHSWYTGMLKIQFFF